MPSSISITETAIGVIHEIHRRGEVNLRTPCSIVDSRHGSIGWNATIKYSGGCSWHRRILCYRNSCEKKGKKHHGCNSESSRFFLYDRFTLQGLSSGTKPPFYNNASPSDFTLYRPKSSYPAMLPSCPDSNGLSTLRGTFPQSQ
jgi:hypothetical protein